MHPSLVALLHPYYLIFIWFQQMLRKNVKCLEFCPVTMFRSKASVSAHWPVRAQALITVFMATVSGGNVLPCHAAKNARLKGPCWPIWCRNATTIYESMRLLLVAYDLWLYSHDDLMITSDCSWFSRYCSCGHFWWFLYDLWCFFWWWSPGCRQVQKVQTHVRFWKQLQRQSPRPDKAWQIHN